jgi:hypothetical protein
MIENDASCVWMDIEVRNTKTKHAKAHDRANNVKCPSFEGALFEMEIENSE